MTTTQYVAPGQNLPSHAADCTILHQVFTAPLAAVTPAKPAELPASVQRLPMTPLLNQAAEGLARDIYYAPHSTHLGPRCAAAGEQRLAAMLAHGARGCLYRKGAQPVALLLLLPNYQHPNIHGRTLHVAFWGYARERVTRSEAVLIKNDWLRQVHATGAAALSLQVGFFNPPGLKFATSLGLAPHSVRVDHVDAAA